jgi:hypothetical protein
MSDEKTTIYISPEEDLTSVRERLEKIPAHYITLVIPTETQLRSHVAWKLLRARVRELGKEVQIVSDSAQVRSVARDVNFKVASSLEASPTGKSRPPSSRPGRVLGNRSRPTGSIQRSATRRSTNLRGPERSYQSGPADQWQSSTDRSLEQHVSDNSLLEDDEVSDSTHQSSAPAFNNDFPLTPDKGQHYDFHIDTSPPIRPLPPQYLEEEPDLWSEDTDVARSIREAASQGGGSEAGMSDQEDDFDLEQDQNEPFDTLSQRYRMTPRPHLGEDPLDSMDDALPPPPIRQQRGAVPFSDSFETQEHTIQDVPDMPLDTLHGPIEDDEDQGNFVVHSDVPPAWGEPIAEDDQDRAGPSRVHGIRPRSSRAGRQSSPQPQLPPAIPGQGFDSDDDLPSVPDVPTRMTPQVPPVQPAASGTSRPSRELQPPQRRSGGLPSTPLARRSGGLSQGTSRSGGLPPASSSRVSGAMTPQNIRPSGGLQNQSVRRSGNLPQNAPRSGGLPPEQVRQGSRSTQLRPDAAPGSRTGSSQLTASGRQRAVLSRPGGTRPGRGAPSSRQGPPTRATVKRTSRRRSPLAILSTLTAIILVAIMLLLYWLLPKAIVTVVLPSQNYSVPVKLLAAPNSQTDAAVGTVQETTLKKDFTISGTGKATGSTKVGTASATGTVFFTNNGDQQIIIPSNIVLSTSSGIQFVTQDNIALGPKNSVLSRQPSFIQAQVSGDSGNVPVGSITIIPAATKNQIEQYNSKIPASAIDLQVTNDDPTSGGGVGNAISVTQKDLDNAQLALSSQLQNSVNTWLQQQLATGDVAGKPIVTPTLTNAPKVDTIEQSGTFPANLKQSVEVAVVRRADLRAATIAQLNASLSQDKNHQNYQIASDTQQAVNIPPFTPVSNGLSMTLSFKPTGEIIQKITSSDIQRNIVNKSPADAEATLKNLMPVIQAVQVKILPGWLPLTPIRSGNISVQFVAGSAVPAKK